MKQAMIITSVASMIDQFNLPNIQLLQSMGYEVTVITDFDEPGNMAKEKAQILLENLKDKSIKVYNISMSRYPFHKKNYSAFKKIKQIISETKFDIIHCQSPVGGFIGRLAAIHSRKIGTKVIYTGHGFHFYKGAPLRNWLLFYPVERFLANYTDTLITINEEDFYRARDFNVGHLEYVRGVGIDLNKIKINKEKVYKLKHDLEITGKNFVLCSVGELNHNKNHSIVFEALNQIKNKNIKYLIIGSGELEKELMMEVKRLELENQVIFLGFRDDIYELLSLSDVFVFPSFREGLSKALMEAMAVGKPVIASNIRGNKDLINNDEGGLLFDPKNAIQLSESIMKMLNDESFRNNASAINMKKIKLCSLDNILERMSEIYQ
ncbi:glycosyltransferase family 4 protein [Aerococcus viridans]